MNTPQPKRGTCEVHQYALNDARPIYQVQYCGMCNAYICEQCSGSFMLRAIAAYNKAKAIANTRRVGL